MTIAWLVLTVAVPLIFFWRLIKLWSQPRKPNVTKPKIKTTRLIAATTCLLYVFTVIAIIVYFWLVFTPEPSPHTSLSADAQRWIGAITNTTIAFMLGAPLAGIPLIRLQNMTNPEQ